MRLEDLTTGRILLATGTARQLSAWILILLLSAVQYVVLNLMY